MALQSKSRFEKAVKDDARTQGAVLENIMRGIARTLKELDDPSDADVDAEIEKLKAQWPDWPEMHKRCKTAGERVKPILSEFTFERK